jgi:hypothetical protein
LFALGLGQRCQPLVIVDQRAFVSADGVRAGFERGDEMIDGGLAGLGVERTGLKEDIGFGAFEPFADVARRIRDLREMTAEGGDGVQAFRLGNPAEAARGDSGEAPADVVFAAQFAFLGNEQAEKGSSDVPEADDGEVVGRNERSPFGVRRLGRRFGR